MLKSWLALITWRPVECNIPIPQTWTGTAYLLTSCMLILLENTEAQQFTHACKHQRSGRQQSLNWTRSCVQFQGPGLIAEADLLLRRKATIFRAKLAMRRIASCWSPGRSGITGAMDAWCGRDWCTYVNRRITKTALRKWNLVENYAEISGYA